LISGDVVVSEKKKQKLKEVREDLGKYPVIGIIDMFKLPGRQLHEIRNRLRNEAVIKMVKKRIIKLALKDCGLKGIEELEGYVKGEPALLLSRTDPFKLARTIGSSKSKAFAKAGDIAPMDIMVRAGPTSLSPGPVIGELQRAKIPAAVEGEKITVTKDTLVAREGDVIEKPLADVLVKLGIEPIEIGLNLLAAWEDGHVYSGELLFTPAEKYIEDLRDAGMQAFNLSFNINYYTRENIPFFLSRAYKEACSLAEAADVLTGETVKPLLAKARARAETLKGMARREKGEPEKTEEKEAPEEEKVPKEEKGEKRKEKPEEEKREPGKKGKGKAKKDDDKKKGK
jgi:large subunit ribosomal protein L10